MLETRPSVVPRLGGSSDFRLRRWRLPRPLPPYPNETLKSFVSRLEHANGLPPDGLELDTRPSNTELPTVLSELTGRSVEHLQSALPEFHARRHAVQVPHRDEVARRHLACQHCSLARGMGDQVIVWATHDDLVCHRHQRWLNPAWTAVGQISVASCPEVLQAQRRHRNLISRSGRQRVLAAYEFSFNRCHQWFSTGYHFPATLKRLERLDRAAGQPVSMADPQLLAALYPNVIALTAILASPHWRGLGRSTDAADRWKFYQRIIIEVTDGQTPIGPRDTLRNWIFDAPNTYPRPGVTFSLPEILQSATARYAGRQIAGP